MRPDFAAGIRAMLNIVAILLTLTATFSYVNHRYLKWPMTIGVMAIALAVSLAIIGLDRLGFATRTGTSTPCSRRSTSRKC